MNVFKQVFSLFQPFDESSRTLKFAHFQYWSYKLLSKWSLTFVEQYNSIKSCRDSAMLVYLYMYLRVESLSNTGINIEVYVFAHFFASI